MADRDEYGRFVKGNNAGVDTRFKQGNTARVDFVKKMEENPQWALIKYGKPKYLRK